MALRDSILRYTAQKLQAGDWRIDKLPLWLVTKLAQLSAYTRPVGLQPGWAFGSGEKADDSISKLRKQLWDYLVASHPWTELLVNSYERTKIVLHLGNDFSRSLFLGGCYEPNELCFLSSVLKRGMTFVDVGANEGFYTLFASRRVGTSGRVLAFEPSSREFIRFNRNVRMNRLRNVSLYQMALGEETKDVILQVAGAGHDGHNTLGRFIYDVPLAAEESVAMQTLDDVVERSNLRRVDVMKIDVEGAELRVLMGSRQVIGRYRPVLLLEVSSAGLESQGASTQALTDLLHTWGYNLLAFDGSTGRPVPLEGVPGDNQNIVALAGRTRL